MLLASLLFSPPFIVEISTSFRIALGELQYCTWHFSCTPSMRSIELDLQHPILFKCWAFLQLCKRASPPCSILWCVVQSLRLHPSLLKPLPPDNSHALNQTPGILHTPWLHQGGWWGRAAERELLPGSRRSSLCLYADHCRPSQRKKEDLSVLWLQHRASYVVMCCQSAYIQVTESDLRQKVRNTLENCFQRGVWKVTFQFLCVFRNRCMLLEQLVSNLHTWTTALAGHMCLKVTSAYAAFQLTLCIIAAVRTLRDNKEDTAKQAGELQCRYDVGSKLVRVWAQTARLENGWGAVWSTLALL